MKTYPLVVAIMALGACRKPSEPPAPPTPEARTAGTYQGKLQYFEVVMPATGNPPSGPQQIKWQRDTVLQIVAGAGAVTALGREMPYAGTDAAWQGHAPKRNCLTFQLPAPLSNQAILQLDAGGDSVYIYSRQGGLLYTRQYTFYGKKRP